MLYLESPSGFAPWAGEAIDGAIYPRSVEQHWKQEELAAIGLYAPLPAPPVPEGKVVVATEVERRGNDEVRFVDILEDAPEPTQDELHPPLEPWRFWAVVDMPGSIGDDSLRNIVATHPDLAFRAVAKAKLNNPPGGLFHRSDPLFSNEALLDALSITSDTIDALWAQAWSLPG